MFNSVRVVAEYDPAYGEVLAHIELPGGAGLITARLERDAAERIAAQLRDSPDNAVAAFDGDGVHTVRVSLSANVGAALAHELAAAVEQCDALPQGAPVAHGPLTAEEIAEVARLAAGGETAADIVRKMGRSLRTIRGVLREQRRAAERADAETG